MERVVKFENEKKVDFGHATVNYKEMMIQTYAKKSLFGEERIAVSLRGASNVDDGDFIDVDEIISVNLPDQMLEFPDKQFFLDEAYIDPSLKEFLIKEGYLIPTERFGVSGFSRYEVFELGK